METHLTMILCSSCGAENAPEAAVCRMCNSPLEALPDGGRTGETRALSPTRVTPKAPAASITCPACSASNVPTYLFCQKCGARLNQPASAPAPVAEAEHEPADQVVAAAESAA